MTTADSYRRMAAQLRSRAANQKNPKLAEQLDHLARCYLRLAEQADQNSRQDLWAEFGSKFGATGEGA
jgi:hypothetical protein